MTNKGCLTMQQHMTIPQPYTPLRHGFTCSKLHAEFCNICDTRWQQNDDTSRH